MLKNSTRKECKKRVPSSGLSSFLRIKSSVRKYDDNACNTVNETGKMTFYNIHDQQVEHHVHKFHCL